MLFLRLVRDPKAIVGGLVLGGSVIAFLSFAAKGDPRAYYNSFIRQYRALDEMRVETLFRAWDPQSPAKMKTALDDARAEVEKAKSAANELYAPPETESGDLHKAYLKYLDDYQAMLAKLDVVARDANNPAARNQWYNLLSKTNNGPLDQFDQRCEAFARTHGAQ